MDEQLYVHHSRTEKAKSQEVREKTKTLITKRETQVALDDFNVLRVPDSKHLGARQGCFWESDAGREERHERVIRYEIA
jgi:hypothetical protein